MESTWIQVGNNINGKSAGDKFGHLIDVSADGSRVAVGAWGDDNDNGEDAGHVCIHDWYESTWTQVGDDIDGEAADDWSGVAVTMSADGNRVGIGAENNRGENSGHFRVYEMVDSEVTLSPSTSPSTSEPVWVSIFFYGFEDGFDEDGFGGNFISGGNKASIKSNKQFEGLNSLRIKDNQWSSRAYSNFYDVSGYSQLSLVLRFYSLGVEDDEGFKLQYDIDGEGFELAKYFVKGTDWNGNWGSWKWASISMPPMSK